MLSYYDSKYIHKTLVKHYKFETSSVSQHRYERNCNSHRIKASRISRGLLLSTDVPLLSSLFHTCGTAKRSIKNPYSVRRTERTK